MYCKLKEIIIPRSKTSYSAHMILAGIIVVSGVFFIPPNSLVDYLWITLSFIALSYYYALALKPRKCGHGVISRGRILFRPWAVDPCPKCKKSTF